MEFLIPTILITIATLFSGCSSDPDIADKNDSNEALQIVTSSGTHNTFRDSQSQKHEVVDVGLMDYMGSTLMSLPLGSMTTGFAIASRADPIFGWENVVL